MEEQITHFPPAIWIRNAYKQYGTKGKCDVILNGLNMTVPKGCIYGLLGASGCGKTTLLNCVISQKKIDSGQILVFGAIPGSKESGIPGPQCGYMPQELALMISFTIGEAIKYYGWVGGLSKERIKQRTDALITLLSLPDKNRIISKLSGGQQRRTSLACALVHEPKLLILDEPTVGLDSVPRKAIWDYLRQISKRTTIIITTHYIEETRQADLVAFMRNGVILAEDSPPNVIARFNVETLEEVFLKLSVMQNVDCSNAERNVTLRVNAQSNRVPEIRELKNEKYHDRLNQGLNLRRKRILAITWKHIIWSLRNYITVGFFLSLSACQIILFHLAIGHNPEHINVAVVNYETNNSACNDTLACNITHLSCVYLQYMKKEAFTLTFYDSEKLAVKSVMERKSYASITVKPNYSKSLRRRIKHLLFPSDFDIEQSEINVFRDTSDMTISIYVTMYLYRTFQSFVQDYLESCGINKKVLALPVHMEKPVYGPEDFNLSDFFIPGVVITVVFFLCIGMTAMVLIIDRNSGDLDRVIVSGATVTDMVVGYSLAEGVLMITQEIIVLICVFVVLQAPLKGSFFLVTALIFLTSLCGMFYGLFIAGICRTEYSALLMAMGSLFPLLMVSGIIWPMEGTHFLLRSLAKILPLGKASESLRCIMQKGWGMNYPQVYDGFLYMTIWSALFIILAFISIRFFKQT